MVYIAIWPNVEYAVKELIRNKKLKMNESDESKQTLLMLAAKHGQYELVATAINLGAEIDRQDKDKNTALKIAKSKGYALYWFAPMSICSLSAF